MKFNDGQFLQILKGESDGLLEISIRVEEEAKLVSDICKFICNDYSNEMAALWNEQRKQIALYATETIIFPQTVKWIKERLGNQASEFIASKCQQVMENVYF